MASANKLPRKKPSRGMAAWKPPNQIPQTAPSLKPAFFMDKPLQIDTAKASMLRPSASSNSSATSINFISKSSKKYSRATGAEAAAWASMRSVSSFQLQPGILRLLTAARLRADYSLFEWDYISKSSECQDNAQKVHNCSKYLYKITIFYSKTSWKIVERQRVLFPRIRIY